jgi:hypothetical protein
MELSLSSSDYDNKLTHLDCDGDQPFFFPLFTSILATYLVYCWFKLNHVVFYANLMSAISEIIKIKPKKCSPWS